MMVKFDHKIFLYIQTLATDDVYSKIMVYNSYILQGLLRIQ